MANGTIRLLFAALVLCSATSAAAAGRGAGASYTRASYPYGERVNQPLTLPATMLRLDLPLAANLSDGSTGEPVFLPVAFDVGVTDDLQVGLFHGTGLCLSGKDNGCPEVYDDVGLRAVLGISRQPESQLALEAAFRASSLEASSYLAGAGAAYKRSLGNVGVTLEAGLLVAVSDRSRQPVKQLLFANAEGAVQFGDSLAVFALVGLDKPIDTAAGTSDRLGVPVGFGLEVEPVNKITFSGELAFPNLLGQEATGREREGRIILRVYI